MDNETENKIIETIKTKKYIGVNELASIIFMSPSSVRRELSALERKGLVTRTHGGVKIIDSNNAVPNFVLRSHQNVLEKKIIALKAIKMIKEGDVIFLDGSTSSYFIADYLSEFKHITVITNGIDTLSLLSHHNVNAYSTGGKISPENPSALVGHYAESMIDSIHSNLAFFSCQSLNSEGVVSDCYEEENEIRKKMIKNTDKSVFLCDSTKLNRNSAHILCGINDVNAVVCDKDIRPNIKCELKTELII